MGAHGVQLPVIHGRGAGSNPRNRFERLDVLPELEHLEGDQESLDALARPATQYFADHSKSAITTNDSPDVGFFQSINPYRGCSHGCIYCYARPTHEYLGFSAGLDFETKITVKRDAAQLLRRELSSPRYEPKAISISGVTDCYQPAEKQFRITRQCLEVLAEFRHPVGVITKNHLVTRDIDLLARLASHDAAVAYVSVTTLDTDLARRMEPRTSSPARRLEAIRKLTAAGIPTGVMIAPVVPGLTDHEMPAILKAVKEAGARFVGFVPLRLPHGVAGLFETWLEHHFPDRKEKVLNRIRSLRGGKLNDPNFKTRMRGQGPWAEQLRSMFHLHRQRLCLERQGPELSTHAFRVPGRPVQMGLF